MRSEESLEEFIASCALKKKNEFSGNRSKYNLEEDFKQREQEEYDRLIGDLRTTQNEHSNAASRRGTTATYKILGMQLSGRCAIQELFALVISKCSLL